MGRKKGRLRAQPEAQVQVQVFRLCHRKTCLPSVGRDLEFRAPGKWEKSPFGDNHSKAHVRCDSLQCSKLRCIMHTKFQRLVFKEVLTFLGITSIFCVEIVRV